MTNKDCILRFVEKHGVVRTADVVRFSKISRQAAAKHLRELVTRHKLFKEGSTNSSRYIPFDPKRSAKQSKGTTLALMHRLKGLEEDKVFEEAAGKIKLSRHLSPAAFKVVRYAFTEMLNNAIDHSRAAKASLHFSLANGTLTFKVVDRGVGVFESVRRKFKLKDHYEAAEHLLKGKQTTDPARHSGQGIFFSSRIADHFTLESMRLKLDVDNERKDIGLLDIGPSKGTTVMFSLKQRSRKDLKELFDEYSDTDLEFDRTKIKIRLSPKAGEYVSRSEAKRLLFGLEKFRRIEIDFSNVHGIGQGFADEIFRVFPDRYPGILLEPLNMSDSVAFMVSRAIKESLRSKK
ncbi:MAG: DUF4325 domain-containing protein [Candidatus Omnitrophota bacterium]|jgi:anti-sigma regulatory factor (Ser/Thr protein kinase)